MKLLIFRTDIKTKKRIRAVKPLFKNNTDIIDWSIDLEDIDNVLRIEATENLLESDIVSLINTEGFYCDALAD